VLQSTIENAIKKAPIEVQFSQAGLDAMTKLGIGTDMMPDFTAGAGKSSFDIQMSMMGENFRNSQFGLAQSFDKLAEQFRFVPRQLDIQERLFEIGVEKQEKQMDRGWDKFLTQWQWGLADLTKNFERSQVRSGWAEEGLALQTTSTQLQYGWGQEDIEEGLRYATGRDRRKLLRQQERQTISFGISMTGADMQQNQIEVQRGWAEEDYAIALDRHNQNLTWQQEEMAIMQQSFYEEIALRRELMDINREVTMNDMTRQQASLMNAQYHMAIMQQEQGQLMAIQSTVEGLGAQGEYFRNVIDLTTEGLTELGESVNGFVDTVGASFIQFGESAAQMIQRMASAFSGGGGGGGGLFYLPTITKTYNDDDNESVVPGKTNADLVYCQANRGKEECEWLWGPSAATGGAVIQTGSAFVHRGEQIIPQNGSMILREPEVVQLLSKILTVLSAAQRNGNKVDIVVHTNDPKSGYDYGLSLSREMELN